MRYENDSVEDHLDIYRKARLVTCDIYGDEGRAYAHNTIGCCDAVSVVTDAHEEDTFIAAAKDGFGKLQVFAVGAILKYRKRESWVVAKLMEEHNSLFTVRSSRVYLLLLSEGVRRVGLVHNCVQCEVGPGKRSIKHSAEALEGGEFTVLKRVDGYPPHLG